MGGRRAESIGIGERMFAFDFRGGSDQWLVYREELNGKLFEKMDCVHRLGGADASPDDVVELAPVDPVEDGTGAGFFLVVQRFLHNLPAGFAVKKTDEGKTIENKFFAHGASLRDAPGGDLESGNICLSKTPSQLRSDRTEQA
jgi:hypothetical protein